MSGWNINCKHSPSNPFAKHCKQQNQGKKSVEKAESRGRPVGKGNYKCARHCKYFEGL